MPCEQKTQTTLLRNCRIDTGDSNEGVAGFVAYVEAVSAEGALNTLRERIAGSALNDWPLPERIERPDGSTVRVFEPVDAT